MTVTQPNWDTGVPRPQWLDWAAAPGSLGAPRLVVNDACLANAWTPSSGTMPVLGTGGFTSGDVIVQGKKITARATAQFGPNSSSNTKTTFATNISTDKLTLTAHAFTNGMAVIPSNLGDTVLPAATNLDGSYFVVNATANDLQLSLTSGGAAIDLTGANATNVTLTAVAASQGSGAYRFSLPSPLLNADRALLRIGGVAQMYDDAIAQLDFGVDPGEYQTATLHTAPSLLDGTTVGLVLAKTLPLTSLQGGYTFTNHTTLRTLDENAVSNPPTQAEVQATRHVLGTIAADIALLLAQNASINVGSGVPWAWGPNYRLEALMIYRAA